MFVRRLLFTSVLLLCGCSTSMQSIVDVALIRRTTGDQRLKSIQLNPDYRYLRIAVGGRATLMLLGYVDHDPLGPIETWYSAGAHETLRLQNGRVVGGTGLPVEWTSVHLSMQPEWSEVSSSTRIERRRDVMPGYQYGLTDAVSVSAIAEPRSNDYEGKRDASLHWFIEISSGGDPLPPARYAIRFDNDTATVVYGEQCFNADFCISWQRWPNNS
jgi:hypothetical protein